MPDIIEWPANLAVSDRSDPQLDFNTRSGGVSIDGSEQILSPLSERWRWRIFVPIHRQDQARSIRVIKAMLGGRFNYVRIRVCDQYRISRLQIGATFRGTVPHSDTSPFSDLSTYDLAQPTSPVMVAASINSQQITIRASDLNGAMSSGVFISINDWLYLVENWVVDGSNYVVDIAPPLKEAITTSDTVEFDARAVWRLDTDDEGALDLQIGRFGGVTLNLVEPVGR